MASEGECHSGENDEIGAACEIWTRGRSAVKGQGRFVKQLTIGRSSKLDKMESPSDGEAKELIA